MVRRFFALVIVLIVVTGGAASPASAQSPSASNFVAKLSQEAIKMLADKSLTIEVRQERFADVLRRALDFDVIGRLSIGKYWQKATPEQQKTYLKVFSDFLIKKYSVLVRGYGGEALNVISEAPLNDTDVWVRTQIQRTNGENVSVEWLARNRGGHWRIIDAVVEGISFVVTQRAEFSSIIERHGIDGLIEKLKKATAPVDAASDQ